MARRPSLVGRKVLRSLSDLCHSICLFLLGCIRRTGPVPAGPSDTVCQVPPRRRVPVVLRLVCTTGPACTCTRGCRSQVLSPCPGVPVGRTTPPGRCTPTAVLMPVDSSCTGITLSKSHGCGTSKRSPLVCTTAARYPSRTCS